VHDRHLVQRATPDLWQLWFFRALGYGMRKAKIPLSPCVIGFVLGPIFEGNLRRTSMLTGGDTLGYLAGRPVTLVILSLPFPVLQSYHAHRQGRGALAR
jgi:putative tricarboxylic transport membrane protein